MGATQPQAWLFAALMLLAGFGIPIMAALNGGLAMRIQSTAAASTILLAFALGCALIVTLTTEGIPKTVYQSSTPFYYYMAGFFVVFYTFTITWVGPRFGVGNAVAFVLLGQLIAMTIIDQYGLFDSPQISLSLQRIIGLVFMTAGVFLVVRN
ncbi:MAG: EamA-like transporter family protein [Pseudomonadales bacterium]|nr:EamA-like transporter family protein [Pseudomonadales bacterium]